MSMRWYVIKAIPGRENRARDNIFQALKLHGASEAVEELLIPVERLTELKRGKKVVVEHKLYPGYIYVKMAPTNEVLEIIRNVDGVTGCLGSDPNAPEPLSEAEAETIVKISSMTDADEQRAALINVPFEVDDRIRVKEGTFAGMEGVVGEIDAAKGRVRVLITVFGRQTPIDLEVWQVEEVS